MALDINVRGSTSGTGVEVAGTNQLKIIPETDATANAANIGGVRIFGEYDQGGITGVPAIYSPEIDSDFRTRVAQDLMYDDVVFNYTAQDTGKYSISNNAISSGWAIGQFTTNNSSLTTAGFTALATYAFFPVMGTQTLSGDFEIGFSAQPQTNAIIEFGFMLGSAANGIPSDGVFFRLSSSGLQGVSNNNGTETVVNFPASNGTGSWTYTNNKKYQFIVYVESISADFWVNDGTNGTRLLGSIPLPVGQGRMVASSALPLVIRQRHATAAGGVIQALVGSYSVRVGGSNVTTVPSIQGNRIMGAYEGMQGGTQGSLANYANSTNPTAAVPTNTTAALGSGLGGQFWETASLAVNTDGIICSYQVPAGTVSVPGKRLVIRGISLASYIQTVIVGGPYVVQYSLAWGHTAVSLATAESVVAKAPRRIALPFNQLVTAAQAVSTLVTQQVTSLDLGDAPIYVNPGEFIQLVSKHVGTAATSGVVAHQVTFVYGWE